MSKKYTYEVKLTMTDSPPLIVVVEADRPSRAVCKAKKLFRPALSYETRLLGKVIEKVEVAA